MKIRYCLFAMMMACQNPSFADIDIKNANFHQTWSDINVGSLGFDLTVSRTYNSRSLYKGIFGLGWSSNLEMRLQKLPEGQIKVINCDCGLQKEFYPQNFSFKRKTQLLAQIHLKLKAEQKTPQEINDIISKIENDDEARLAWAKKYNLLELNTEQTTFENNSEKVTYLQSATGGVYTWQRFDGTRYTFNEQGLLVTMEDRSGNYLRYSYINEKLDKIESATGQYLQLSYNAKNQLTKINSSTGENLFYAFDQSNSLNKVKKNGSDYYRYQYDDLFNLTKITHRKNLVTSISYDTNNDWVTKIKYDDGCTQNFVYDFDQAMPDMHYWLTTKVTCEKRVISNDKYEFLYQYVDDIQDIKLFEQTKHTQDGMRKVIYDLRTEKPKFVETEQTSIKYDYNDKGQLLTKEMIDKTDNRQFYHITFGYAQNDLINTVTLKELDFDTNVSTQKVAYLNYNANNQLIFIQDYQGDKFDITYNDKGLIETMLASDGKKLHLEYEPRFGKPHKVSLEGVGEITVTYQSNGQIDKIDGSSMEVSFKVANTMNKLLDKLTITNQDFYQEANLENN